MGGSITSEDIRELEKGLLNENNIRKYRSCCKKSKNCFLLTCNTITACSIGCCNYIYEAGVVVGFYLSSCLE